MNLPKRVRIDACNMCQLKCPLCNTPGRKKEPGNLGWGYLKFDTFKAFLDNNPCIEQIELSWMGEIFMNPELSKIIKYAFKKRVKLTAITGVNFNNVSDEILRNLVKYRFKAIRVSIDGATQKTHGAYRKGGDFKRVIRNIMTLNRYKKEFRTTSPALQWQFIIFGHNEHEIIAARDMAAKLGMDFFPKRSWDNNEWSPLKDPQKVKDLTGEDFTTESDYLEKYGRDYMDDICGQLWDEPVINFDGELYGCCMNNQMSFGNVFKEGLEAVLTSDDYVYMKKMIEGKVPADDRIICTQCHVYKNRKVQTYGAAQ